MREWTYAYRPSLRNAIFYPLTWNQFLGRDPVIIRKDEIRSLHLKFNKVSLRLTKNGAQCELLLNKDEAPAAQILADNQDKISPEFFFWPPAFLRNLGAVAVAFLISAVLYAAVSLWLKYGGADSFSTASCSGECPALMGTALITAVGTLLFHPLGFGLFAVGADEVLQQLGRDRSGRHLVKFGCAVMVLLSLLGASVVPSMSSAKVMHGFLLSVRSLKANQTPDFSYLTPGGTADLSSRSKAP